MKQHVIIILGLGQAARLYRWHTRHWQRVYNVTPHIVTIQWRSDTSLHSSIDQIVALHDHLSQTGSVAIIGISAGASLGLHVQQQLYQQGLAVPLAAICGRFDLAAHRWYPVSFRVSTFPLFYKSVAALPPVLSSLTADQRRYITTFHSLFDEAVPAKSTRIPHAQHRTIPCVLHALSIHYLLWQPRTVLVALQLVA